MSESIETRTTDARNPFASYEVVSRPVEKSDAAKRHAAWVRAVEKRAYRKELPDTPGALTSVKRFLTGADKSGERVMPDGVEVGETSVLFVFRVGETTYRFRSEVVVSFRPELAERADFKAACWELSLKIGPVVFQRGEGEALSESVRSYVDKKKSRGVFGYYTNFDGVNVRDWCAAKASQLHKVPEKQAATAIALFDLAMAVRRGASRRELVRLMNQRPCFEGL